MLGLVDRPCNRLRLPSQNNAAVRDGRCYDELGYYHTPDMVRALQPISLDLIQERRLGLNWIIVAQDTGSIVCEDMIDVVLMDGQ